MANIIFTQEAPSAEMRFRIGREQSLFQNGVQFSIALYQLGRWSGTSQDEGSQSIVLVGKLPDGSEIPEVISVNRFLRKKILFDADGKMKVVPTATFADELRSHLELLGRDETDSRYLKGSADQVAKHILSFFAGKTLLCTLIPGLFGKDKEGRLYDASFVQFSFA